MAALVDLLNDHKPKVAGLNRNVGTSEQCQIANVAAGHILITRETDGPGFKTSPQRGISWGSYCGNPLTNINLFGTVSILRPGVFAQGR